MFSFAGALATPSAFLSASFLIILSFPFIQVCPLITLHTLVATCVCETSITPKPVCCVYDRASINARTTSVRSRVLRVGVPPSCGPPRSKTKGNAKTEKAFSAVAAAALGDESKNGPFRRLLQAVQGRRGRRGARACGHLVVPRVR